MALCQNELSRHNFLEEEETELAIRLAEALQSDEVEIFLEIYDSIPSSTEIQRVSYSSCTLLPCKQSVDRNFLKSCTHAKALVLCAILS